MNKEKLIASWDELKDETQKQILALADKAIKEKYFVPKDGDFYYSHKFDKNKDEVACVRSVFFSDSIDRFFVKTGNAFRTLEEAIFAGNCDYYAKRFETYVKMHTDRLNWGNDDQSKYYAFYNFDDMDIEYDDVYGRKTQGVTYASSEQILKDAIADIGEENFLKYVMKVEA